MDYIFIITELYITYFFFFIMINKNIKNIEKILFPHQYWNKNYIGFR